MREVRARGLYVPLCCCVLRLRLRASESSVPSLVTVVSSVYRLCLLLTTEFLYWFMFNIVILSVSTNAI